MSQYWKARTLANEARSARLADTYMARQKKAYANAYKRILSRLEGLQASIEGGQAITRSELWQMTKYANLKEAIEKEIGILSRKQLADISEACSRIFNDTAGLTLKELVEAGGKYNTLNPQQIKMVLDAEWKNINYSKGLWWGKTWEDRVYGNAAEFASRLQRDMENMIVMGKNPEQIKAALMADFNVSYDVADRLIRTEASHMYNEAAMKTYKAAGIQQVEFLPERDEKICDVCAEKANVNNGIYYIGVEPKLPQHPRCRCCYAPVVDLGSAKT